MSEKPTADRRPDECASCHFETADLDVYRLGTGPEQWKWLCGLCAGTDAGNALAYPTANGHEANAILRTVCYVGNVVLAELKKSHR